ncbi:hypothetical protein OFN55_42565, partial [Escherichia coli]|nr:hypothetical protein [Escherichia coli]
MRARDSTGRLYALGLEDGKAAGRAQRSASAALQEAPPSEKHRPEQPVYQFPMAETLVVRPRE